MAKTKKAAEDKPEVLKLRRTGRNKAKETRPSIVIPIEKSKNKVKNATSASTTTKTRGKTKEKNPPAASKASKKQSKAVPSTSKTAAASDQQQNTSNRNRHGDLMATMRPLRVKVDRLFTRTGQLPRNYLTSIIQKDWHEHVKDKAHTRTNSSLKGIDYFPYQSLQLKEKGGVAYAVYRTKRDDNVRVGLVIIDAGKEKETQKSWQYIRFTVLCGKANLLCEGINEHYNAGTIFTVPPKAKYSIKNVSTDPCYLNFFSYGQQE